MSRNAVSDKQAMLAKLSKTPIVELACKQTGIPRSTYYRWRKEDTAFADACDEAIEHSADLVNDLAESQLINAIKDKSMPAIAFWLRHNHKKYATRVEVNAHVDSVQQELSPEQSEAVLEALRLAGLAEGGNEDAVK